MPMQAEGTVVELEVKVRVFRSTGVLFRNTWIAVAPVTVPVCVLTVML
jgi:hypothetical protein